MELSLIYMISFLVIVIIPLIIGFEFSRQGSDGLIGFISGLCVTLPIGNMVGLISDWIIYALVASVFIIILVKIGVLHR